MTLQEWFDYLKANGKDDRKISMSDARKEPLINFYYDSLHADILKMAYTDKVELYCDEDINKSMKYSTIPDSLREYQRKTSSDFKEIRWICKMAIENTPWIGLINLKNEEAGVEDEYITYSANICRLLDNIKRSFASDMIEKIIEEYKYLQMEISYELDKIVNDLAYDDFDCPEENDIAYKALFEYKKLMARYYLRGMKGDFEYINSPNGSFKKWMAKAIMLQGVHEKIFFFDDIADTVIDFLSKEKDGFVLYNDGRNLRDTKLPNGIYIFIEEFSKKPTNIQELVDYAIQRAGIQELIEVTEDEEKVIYKNKVFM